MIIFAIAVLAGALAYLGAFYGLDFGRGWSVFAGAAALLVAQMGLGFVLQRKVKADMAKVQRILEAGQRKLKEKTQRWQTRPPSSMKAAQKEMFEDTKVFVREAIAETETLRKYRFWVPLIDRQIATAQLQLNWMIKEFKTVDRLMPKAMVVDPAMAAIKMAHLYMNGAGLDEIAKVYRKAVRRSGYNGNVLVAAAMSWMQVQRQDFDGAFKTLTEALKKSDDATLKRNHELLMNNKTAHFSNSGLGDQWYSLYLEEPKYRNPRQHIQYR